MSLFNAGASNFPKFENEGDFIEGVITDAEVRQSTEFVNGRPSNTPAFSKSGRPKMETVLSLETPEGEPIKTAIPEYGNKSAAVAMALREAGAKEEQLIGSYLKLTFTGWEQGRGPMPAKAYKAEFKVGQQTSAPNVTPQAPQQQAPVTSPAPHPAQQQPGFPAGFQPQGPVVSGGLPAGF